MDSEQPRTSSSLIVASGATGTTGELLARTVLAQFQGADIPIVIEPRLHTPAQVEAVVQQAAETGSLIVHTLVDETCRQAMLDAAARHQVWQFDLVGPLIDRLSAQLGQKPAGRPGLYRQSNQSYFNRVEAIEFTVAHDDGKRVQDLPAADIILLGVSRVGKTPLSIYLSVLGWKVANAPLVPGIEPPEEIFAADPRRVVGLIVTPAQIALHRRTRMLHTGEPAESYIDRQRVIEELRAAQHFFTQHKIPVIDVTDKPIETSAEEVIKLINRRTAKW